MFSCTGQNEYAYKELMGKPAIPIIALPGENQIVISDFIIENEKVDSLSVLAGSGMSIVLSEDKSTAVLDVEDQADDISVLTFYSNGNSNDVPVKKSNKKSVTFSYQGDGEEVQIKGEMNAWNPGDSHFTREGDVWEWQIELNPGNYQYLYMIDGKETLDPTNKTTVDNGSGGTNSLLELPRPSIESLPILRTSSFDNEKIIFDLLNKANDIYIFCENKLTSHWNNIEAGKFQVSIPGWAKNNKRTHLRIYASNEIGISQDVLVPLEYGIPVNNSEQLTRYDWHSSIMYFMMVDRFKNANAENDRPTPDPDILHVHG